MENKYGIVGIAHVGLPTNDLQKTVEFYKSLGFEVIMQSYNEKAGEKVAFFDKKLDMNFDYLFRSSYMPV